jgi:hypothetical protein
VIRAHRDRHRRIFLLLALLLPLLLAAALLLRPAPALLEAPILGLPPATDGGEPEARR